MHEVNRIHLKVIGEKKIKAYFYRYRVNNKKKPNNSKNRPGDKEMMGQKLVIFLANLYILLFFSVHILFWYKHLKN